jgi:hypothetical protein
MRKKVYIKSGGIVKAEMNKDFCLDEAFFSIGISPFLNKHSSLKGAVILRPFIIVVK